MSENKTKRAPIICPNCKEPTLELMETESSITIRHYWEWDPKEEHYHETHRSEEDAHLPVELNCLKCKADMDIAEQDGLYAQFRELME